MPVLDAPRFVLPNSEDPRADVTVGQADRFPRPARESDREMLIRAIGFRRRNVREVANSLGVDMRTLLQIAQAAKSPTGFRPPADVEDRCLRGDELAAALIAAKLVLNPLAYLLIAQASREGDRAGQEKYQQDQVAAERARLAAAAEEYRAIGREGGFDARGIAAFLAAMERNGHTPAQVAELLK